MGPIEKKKKEKPQVTQKLQQEQIKTFFTNLQPNSSQDDQPSQNFTQNRSEVVFHLSLFVVSVVKKKENKKTKMSNGYLFGRFLMFILLIQFFFPSFFLCFFVFVFDFFLCYKVLNVQFLFFFSPFSFLFLVGLMHEQNILFFSCFLLFVYLFLYLVKFLES